MQAQVNNSVQYFFAAALLLLLVGSFTWMAPQDHPIVISADDIASRIIIPTYEGSGIDNEKLSEIYDEILRDDQVDDIVEQLVLEELESKDFRRDLVSFLLSNVSELQDIDYRDIEEYDVRDIDIEVDGEDAVVEIELKVYISNFGDSDEEERVRFSVVFEVSELEEDDDYEDAEVTDWYDFNLLRFYD